MFSWFYNAQNEKVLWFECLVWFEWLRIPTNVPTRWFLYLRHLVNCTEILFSHGLPYPQSVSIEHVTNTVTTMTGDDVIFSPRNFFPHLSSLWGCRNFPTVEREHCICVFVTRFWGATISSCWLLLTQLLTTLFVIHTSLWL